MDPVKRQYEAYPYPARDPAEEATRLIEGSPSHPVEIDHFIFSGKRDWTQPMRVLVAGGGTGDALIMLAQLLHDRGAPAEIVYLDMSTASREIAEARAAARGLKNIDFRTGDLLTAPELGPFDYIDCCGVLHHLPTPQAGFDALAEALAPEGGMGVMVYAPFGRAGVYEAQAMLHAICSDDAPEAQVDVGKRLLHELPPSNAFSRNPLVGDHKDTDAGLYDLLLHSRDAPYTAPELLKAFETAGLRLAGFLEPARYEPQTYLRDPELLKRIGQLDVGARAGFAEKLASNMKVHIAYAVPAARAKSVAAPASPSAVPVLHRTDAKALSQSVASRWRLRFSFDGLTIERGADRKLAPLLAQIDGKTSLGALQQRSGADWMTFSAAFGKLYAPLDGFNILRFSRFYEGR
ncbi:MAG: class I SAM-dependent methyltransferase [Neomegalonema sp.]